MNRFYKVVLFSLVCFQIGAQQISYFSLDQNDQIVFLGNAVVYQGDTILLGEKTYFIDGQLADTEATKYPYVFNSVQKAVDAIIDGTEENPMVLLFAPYVYWVDDPDDPDIRDYGENITPFGMKLKCEWLKFKGLNKNTENVVLACNRGQTIGAKGNFTMFRIEGQGTSSENITFGNYCNVDLEFPLKPTLNRKRRANAVVQAQLILCDGDKIVAKNTRFISRLNLCPFVGGKRVFFEQCHFESTDDALNSTAVYKNCTFDFYSSKPFYFTTGTGAVFLNCDVRVLTRGPQYFTKANGQLAVIDSRFTSLNNNYLGWNDEPPVTTKNYQYHVLWNGKPVMISENDPGRTVDLSNKSLLDAYLVNSNGKVLYNTYNLLKGEDDWDPENIKPQILKAEKEKKKSFTNLPTQLKVLPSTTSLVTKKDSLKLVVSLLKFGNFKAKEEMITWSFPPEDQEVVKLMIGKNGQACVVIPNNLTDTLRKVVFTAKTAAGLEATCVMDILPAKLPPPVFIQKPKIQQLPNGTLIVNYTLEGNNYADQSEISWYRCEDKNGASPVEIAVSRNNQPLYTYTLNSGDVGHFIMVKVAPKNQRSDAGKSESATFNSSIKSRNVKARPNIIEEDFKNLSVVNQTLVRPGFWTFAYFDTTEMAERFKGKPAWYYGEGSDGSNNMFGLLQTGRSASMSYTPVTSGSTDTKLTMVVSPFKTAGQGFSVAHLYMDVLINYDAKTKTGYGLRFIRTTKFGNAVDCMIVKYENNVVSQVSEVVITSCFRSPCEITLDLTGNKISADVRCLSQYETDQYPPEVLEKVKLNATIKPFDFAGFGIEYNGGSSTMINHLEVRAKNINKTLKK